MAENLSGIIERVTFHNPDTGFAVLRVQVRGRLGLVTVVGQMPSAVVGEYIQATGEWIQDRMHGEQFKAAELRCAPPHTALGIEKYLGSGLVKGIGPHFAKKIVAVFGERTLQVIDESPAFLKEVKGIGPRRIQRIRESWQEQKAVRDILVFLQSHGVGTGRAVRIYKTYGDQAVELVKNNPYRLATDVWGFGFKTADELAGRLGIDRSSPLRARAALRFVLQEASQEGHVGAPEEAIVRQTAELTNIPEETVRAAVEHERQAGDVVREPGGEEPWLYLKPLFMAELGVARAVRKLREGRHPLPTIDTEAALEWVEKKIGLQLAPTQRDALRAATREKVLIITGGPGVGKSTIVRGILEIFTARRQRCALCAPTGRAAKRLSETTGREAKTIHRLLEFDPAFGGFRRDAAQPLDLDLLVVDEASMVDVVLMNQLLRAAPAHACVVLVGDVDQLPSVGPGLVLADLIDSKTVPVVRLTEIFRQAGQSWIVRAAHAIKHGELPESAPPGKGDFYFVEANTPEAILDRILTMVRERIPARYQLDPLCDIQVLTPMNRSELGAQALNLRLQEVLNPSRGGPQVERFGWTFHVGDKVMQTHNNYQKEVFNGDIGRISAIDETERQVTVEYEGKPVTYDYGELEELSLSFATTVHKSQGSEYPAVVIPLHTQHYMMLQRNLLYTGVTRGKRLVAIVGSRKALEMAVQRQDTSRRYSGLQRRLQEDPG
ncbi:MAG TPA: ATP-dependent RecD-like DNA helicase [Gemmataceae bacterium]|nr:ATP-dependent RecD-like DNA helicase [Gemmataceae bacterium]